MHTALETIQLLVAPVVMISACGLLCLALYNRLAAIVSRARAFHKERFDALAKLTSANHQDEGSPFVQQMRKRVAILDDQVSQILGRARLVRNALILLLSTVLCMLGCSLALGVSIVWPSFANLALWLFLLGIAAMLVSIVLAIKELRRALDPVLIEQEAIEDISPF